MNHTNKVYLVGAGPGDAELLTLKAVKLLERADIVIYDRLVSDDVMALLNPNCVRQYVGKQSHHHTLDQKQINQLLVTLSRQYECVVRLKGGDPFVFGRGGEEAQVLAAAGVPFEIVPGITSAQACAAYSGIPLTHRGYARGVQFLTGHFKKDSPLHWDARGIADPQQTLVVYMGLENIETIVSELLNVGRSPDTPAAIVENGTTQKQRTIITRLDMLAIDVARENVQAPSMLIIGSVVALASELSWFVPSIDVLEELYCAQA